MKKFLYFFVFYAAFVSSGSDENNSLIKYYGKSKNQINIVIKDNIDIEGEVTSAGSLALEKNIAPKNASIVQKLIKLNNGELKFQKSSYGGLKVTVLLQI